MSLLELDQYIFQLINLQWSHPAIDFFFLDDAQQGVLDTALPFLYWYFLLSTLVKKAG